MARLASKNYKYVVLSLLVVVIDIPRIDYGIIY